MEKFLSSLPYITAIITILSAVFSGFKYVDMRNRENERLNYENLNNILKNLAGNITETGEIRYIILTLIGNIYQLLAFKKYKNYQKIIVYILEYYKDYQITASPDQLKHLTKAIDYVLNEFSPNKSSRFFASLRMTK